PPRRCVAGLRRGLPVPGLRRFAAPSPKHENHAPVQDVRRRLHARGWAVGLCGHSWGRPLPVLRTALRPQRRPRGGARPRRDAPPPSVPRRTRAHPCLRGGPDGPAPPPVHQLEASGSPVSSSVFSPLRTSIQPTPDTLAAVLGAPSSRSCTTVSREMPPSCCS